MQKHKKYPKLEHTLWICNVVFIQVITRSTRFAMHLKHYKSYQCVALHRLPTAARDTSSNGLASKNRVPATSEMSSGSGRTLVTRINKQNEDKRKRNRKNKFGDNRRTARIMAAVAIPSTYIITKRLWSWDTQRQAYKKHVSLPQDPTMHLVSVPEKPSPHGFSFASAYRCSALCPSWGCHTTLFATTNNLAATYTRCDAEIHIILSSLHSDCDTDWTVRVSNAGSSKTVFCSPRVVKRSVGLSNRVFIITGIYIDQMKFAAYMPVSFITFFPCSFGSILYHCIYGCIFSMLLSNFVNYAFVCYVFLLLCSVFC